MAEHPEPSGPTEPVPANQVSVHRFAELKRAYLHRLPKKDREALAAAAEQPDDTQD